MVEVETNVATGVDIHWQGKVIRGNNQQVLLEQLEQAGIRVPYSCRAGICGCCRIKLLEGEVSALKNLQLEMTAQSCAVAAYRKRRYNWKLKPLVRG